MKRLFTLLLVLIFVVSGNAQTVKLTWDPNTETDLAGYYVYRSAQSGNYTDALNGTMPWSMNAFTDSAAPIGPNYYVVKAADTTGNISLPSNEVMVIIQPPQVVCPQGQWLAEYFSGMNFEVPVLSQCETSINYDWVDAGPLTPAIPSLTDRFSVRWTGSFSFPSGSTTFTAVTDDGMRVWLDGNQIINSWMNQGATTYTMSQTIVAGLHAVKVEYFEDSGEAVAKFNWTLPPPPPPGDTTPPTVKFYTQNNTIINANTKAFSVGVTDNVGVVKVELYRSGRTAPVDKIEENKLDGTRSLNWQAAPIAKGTYTMTLIGYDAAGNPSLPATITVIRK